MQKKKSIMKLKNDQEGGISLRTIKDTSSTFKKYKKGASAVNLNKKDSYLAGGLDRQTTEPETESRLEDDDAYDSVTRFP